MPRSATWGRRNSNNSPALIPQRRPCAAVAAAFSYPAAAPQTRALRCHRQQAKCPCRASRLARRSSLFWWWRTSLSRNSTTQQMQLSQQVNAQQWRDLQCIRGNTTASQQQSDHTYGCLIQVPRCFRWAPFYSLRRERAVIHRWLRLPQIFLGFPFCCLRADQEICGS